MTSNHRRNQPAEQAEGLGQRSARLATENLKTYLAAKSSILETSTSDPLVKNTKL
jgi:hypothetical protein